MCPLHLYCDGDDDGEAGGSLMVMMMVMMMSAVIWDAVTMVKLESIMIIMIVMKIFGISCYIDGEGCEKFCCVSV